jgi:hypothetical protein
MGLGPFSRLVAVTILIACGKLELIESAVSIPRRNFTFRSHCFLYTAESSACHPDGTAKSRESQFPRYFLRLF